MDESVAALVAKHEIEEVVLRYCRGIDRMDRELVRSCYHPDASDEHGSFHGGVDAFLDWVMKLLARYETTMHFIGNVLVELAGDAAVAESYGVAWHRSPDPRPQWNPVTGFRTLDRFERRDDAVWRIARRVAVPEWSRVDDPKARWVPPPGLRVGRRDRSDALYELLDDLRRS
ncbi:MAG: nuclear transport factor 2 family protein [Myxococcales bacterium]|nr:MAG: nuclear transport factor 2 family protein [Myxococcales bacterium]